MTPELQAKIIDAVNTCDGWCTPEKALHLASLVTDNAIHTTVEVGIFGGKSLIPMAMACQFQGFGTVHGMDPWTATAALEGDNDLANDIYWSQQIDLEAIYRGFIQRTLTYGLTKQCYWYRCKSEEASRLFHDGSVGLVHCDGNHSEKKSTEDVDIWLPKLKPNGVFVMDDSNWPSTQKAVAMLKEKGGFKSVEVCPHGAGQEYTVFAR